MPVFFPKHVAKTANEIRCPCQVRVTCFGIPPRDTAGIPSEGLCTALIVEIAIGRHYIDQTQEPQKIFFRCLCQTLRGGEVGLHCCSALRKSPRKRWSARAIRRTRASLTTRKTRSVVALCAGVSLSRVTWPGSRVSCCFLRSPLSLFFCFFSLFNSFFVSFFFFFYMPCASWSGQGLVGAAPHGFPENFTTSWNDNGTAGKICILSAHSH